MAKVMEIDVSRIETRVTITDDERNIKRIRNYFLYRGSMTLIECLELAFNNALRYGVTEIQVIQDGVGCQAYDYILNLVQRGGFALDVKVIPFRSVQLT